MTNNVNIFTGFIYELICEFSYCNFIKIHWQFTKKNLKFPEKVAGFSSIHEFNISVLVRI